MEKNTLKEKLKIEKLSLDELELVNGGVKINDFNEEEYNIYMTLLNAYIITTPNSSEAESAWNELSEFWKKMKEKYG